MSRKSKNSILKGSFWVVLASMISRLAGLISLPFLARVLGPADLGLYNLVFNTVQVGENLSRIGVDSALHRNGAQYETIGLQAVGRMFGVGTLLVLGMSCIISSSLWVFRDVVSIYLLGEARIEPWIGIISLIIILTSISNPTWWFLVALHDFRNFSIRNSTISVINALLTIFSAWMFGIIGAILTLGIVALIQVIWGWFISMPELRKRGIKLRFDSFYQVSQDILTFGFPFYLSNFLSGFVALPLLGYVSRSSGIEQIGYLRVAQSLSQLVSFLPNAVAPVLLSILSASHSSDITEYRSLKSLHLRSLWSITLIISLAISFSLDFLVPALFGLSYTQAILFSRLTIWNVSLQSLSGIFTQHLVSSGKTRLIAVIQITSIISNVFFSLILIPHYGSMGLLIGQSISIVVAFTAGLKSSMRDFESKEKNAVFLLIIIHTFSIIITFIISLLSISALLKYLISFVLISVVSFVLTQLAFTEKERFEVFNELGSKFRNILAKS